MITTSNNAFIAALKPLDGTKLLICSKPGDPTQGGWSAYTADQVDTLCLSQHNNYLNTGCFQPDEQGHYVATKAQAVAAVFIVLDDVGTKAPIDVLDKLEPSWQLETSPGNFQVGYIFDAPLDAQTFDALQKNLVAVGYSDKGAQSISRWVRLPQGINGKAAYLVEDQAFRVKLVQWNPTLSYSPEQIADAFGVQLSAKQTKAESTPKKPQSKANDKFRHDLSLVYQASVVVDDVIAALKQQGLYQQSLGQGKHRITCPWADEHTGGDTSGTVYFEPSRDYPMGGFKCHHSHGEDLHVGDLYRHLGLNVSGGKPKLFVISGLVHCVVEAIEYELSLTGRYYLGGQGLVELMTAENGVKIERLNEAKLSLILSEMFDWFIARKEYAQGEFSVITIKQTNPVDKIVRQLLKLNHFNHLLKLEGLVEQPYFWQDQLVTASGYNSMSQYYANFNQHDYELPEVITREMALDSLTQLNELLKEFPFKSEQDRSLALSAILTATVRTALPLSPGFNISAHSIGSGKSYLSELIGLFATIKGNQKVAYPDNDEEANKLLLSLLSISPGVIEFDDMTKDWKALGTINRMFTAETLSGRILGSNQTMQVSTRCLILGSGNNVEPERDLLRRVMTISLDPHEDNVIKRGFSFKPVDLVKARRPFYIKQVLTIILAWRQAGYPRAADTSLASYGGAWSDFCRHPLVWLGLPDPGQVLITQVVQDTSSESLALLLETWHKKFKSQPTTVRKFVGQLSHNL